MPLPKVANGELQLLRSIRRRMRDVLHGMLDLLISRVLRHPRNGRSKTMNFQENGLGGVFSVKFGPKKQTLVY